MLFRSATEQPRFLALDLKLHLEKIFRSNGYVNTGLAPQACSAGGAYVTQFGMYAITESGPCATGAARPGDGPGGKSGSAESRFCSDFAAFRSARKIMIGGDLHDCC